MNASVSTIHVHPRNLSMVLDDLREARSDLDSAFDDIDRATEAEQRLETLRTEFQARHQSATGLTWGQIQSAIESALI